VATIGNSNNHRFEVSGSIESEHVNGSQERIAFVDAFLAKARENILLELGALDSKKVEDRVGFSLSFRGEISYSAEGQVKLGTSNDK
jgi:hypothetical protein